MCFLPFCQNSISRQPGGNKCPISTFFARFPEMSRQEEKVEFGEVSTHAVILSERSESKDLPTWGGG